MSPPPAGTARTATATATEAAANAATAAMTATMGVRDSSHGGPGGQNVLPVINTLRESPPPRAPDALFE